MIKINIIHSYGDYVNELHKAGFTMAGGNTEGVFSLCDYFGPEIQWHQDPPETNPWTWRIQLLNDFDDIAYGKYFFRKGGYITKAWAPYFLALRRSGGVDINTLYFDGKVSRLDKSIYDFICEREAAGLHDIKQAIGKKGVESALCRLQANMFITINGETQKRSRKGEAYGWPINTYCPIETFWGESLIGEAKLISTKEAQEKITERLKLLNPSITDNAIHKFLRA